MMGLLQINRKHMVSASQESLIFKCFFFFFTIIKTNYRSRVLGSRIASIATAQLLQQTDQLLFILLTLTGEPLFKSIYQISESDISNLAI